jgi:predicted nucleic-acid-binding Zn-ribbon protein
MRKCANCGSESVYMREGVTACGGYGPDLLPGLGGFWSGPDFAVFVCSQCGLTQFFASEAARDKLKSSNKWKRV